MIIKIVLLGICICIINLFLRQYQGTFVIIINIAFVILVALLLFENAAEPLRSLNSLLKISASGSVIIKSLYKAVLISIITELASDICKESGNTVISDMIELGGRIMLMVISLPFIESVIKAASSFAE